MKFPVIMGTPMNGEKIDGTTFDGKKETAVFPGDLPDNPRVLFDETSGKRSAQTDLRFVRFRPPSLEKTAEGLTLSLPHISLTARLNFCLATNWLRKKNV